MKEKVIEYLEKLSKDKTDSAWTLHQLGKKKKARKLNDEVEALMDAVFVLKAGNKQVT